MNADNIFASSYVCQSAAYAERAELQRRAIACMTEHGCYAVPVGNELPPQSWKVRTRHGLDVPIDCYQRGERDGRSTFSDPVEALAWVYDWLQKVS